MKMNKILKSKGLILRQTHNLIQVRNSLGTVYQSHSKSDIATWLMGVGVFVTIDNPIFGKDRDTDYRTCPRRYGRVTMRP